MGWIDISRSDLLSNRYPMAIHYNLKDVMDNPSTQF